MKISTLATLALTLIPALAHADQRLTCQLDAPRLNIEVLNTSLFVPATFISEEEYDGSRVSPFLEGSETSLQISNSNLSVNLRPDACVIDLNNPKVLAACHRGADQEPRVDRSGITYEANTKSPSGTEEHITVSRHLDVVSADLVLTLVDAKSVLDQSPTQRVHSDLTVVAKVEGETRTLHLTRDEGEWTSRTDRSNYDRCIFTNDRATSPSR